MSMSMSMFSPWMKQAVVVSFEIYFARLYVSFCSYVIEHSFVFRYTNVVHFVLYHKILHVINSVNFSS